MSEPTHNIICWWSGAVANIPEGWKLCNGNNNTPDLRNQFIIGAGDTYSPNDSDGSINHTHNFTSDFHSHRLKAGIGTILGTDLSRDTDSKESIGTTEVETNLPPYYALCLIMKT